MDQTNQESSRKDVIEQLLEKPSGETVGIGRSYECNFCKRGFTNAQALGGHMNIHRKEKAKATKQKQDDDHKQNYQNYPKEDHHQYHMMMTNSMYYSSINSSTHPQQQISNHPTSLVSYPFHFRSPSIPGYLPRDESGQRSERVDIVKESHLGVNLSLQIGDSSVVKVKKIEETEGNEVDLELRLGVDQRDDSTSS